MGTCIIPFRVINLLLSLLLISCCSEGFQGITVFLVRVVNGLIPGFLFDGLTLGKIVLKAPIS